MENIKARIMTLEEIEECLLAAGQEVQNVDATMKFLIEQINLASTIEDLPDCFHTTLDEVLAEDGVIEDLVDHPTRQLLYSNMSYVNQDRVLAEAVPELRLQVAFIIEKAIDKVAREVIEDKPAMEVQNETCTVGKA